MQVCKYIDIPLQHVSNLVLLSMNRPPKDHTVKLLHKLRERIPDLVLRTTFICGFPGETKEQHKELVDFCKDFKFERMGAFAYSEEDGTPAAEFPEQVPTSFLFHVQFTTFLPRSVDGGVPKCAQWRGRVRRGECEQVHAGIWCAWASGCECQSVQVWGP